MLNGGPEAGGHGRSRLAKVQTMKAFKDNMARDRAQLWPPRVLHEWDKG
jgi:hypothetical protein